MSAPRSVRAASLPTRGLVQHVSRPPSRVVVFSPCAPTYLGALELGSGQQRANKGSQPSAPQSSVPACCAMRALPACPTARAMLLSYLRR